MSSRRVLFAVIYMMILTIGLNHILPILALGMTGGTKDLFTFVFGLPFLIVYVVAVRVQDIVNCFNSTKAQDIVNTYLGKIS